MSDSSDDMEMWSSYLEAFDEMKINNALERIIECDISEFKNERHMINYIKKIAKNILKELENE